MGDLKEKPLAELAENLTILNILMALKKTKENVLEYFREEGLLSRCKLDTATRLGKAFNKVTDNDVIEMWFKPIIRADKLKTASQVTDPNEMITLCRSDQPNDAFYKRGKKGSLFRLNTILTERYETKFEERKLSEYYAGTIFIAYVAAFEHFINKNKKEEAQELFLNTIYPWFSNFGDIGDQAVILDDLFDKLNAGDIQTQGTMGDLKEKPLAELAENLTILNILMALKKTKENVLEYFREEGLLSRCKLDTATRLGKAFNKVTDNDVIEMWFKPIIRADKLKTASQVTDPNEMITLCRSDQPNDAFYKRGKKGSLFRLNTILTERYETKFEERKLSEYYAGTIFIAYVAAFEHFINKNKKEEAQELFLNTIYPWFSNFEDIGDQAVILGDLFNKLNAGEYKSIDINLSDDEGSEQWVQDIEDRVSHLDDMVEAMSQKFEQDFYKMRKMIKQSQSYHRSGSNLSPEESAKIRAALRYLEKKLLG